MLGGTGFAAGVAKARREQMQAARDARRVEQEAEAQHAAAERLVASLQELKALRDAGALSTEEFEAAKRKVLSG